MEKMIIVNATHFQESIMIPIYQIDVLHLYGASKNSFVNYPATLPHNLCSFVWILNKILYYCVLMSFGKSRFKFSLLPSIESSELIVSSLVIMSGRHVHLMNSKCFV